MSTQVSVGGQRGSFNGAVGVVDFRNNDLMNVTFYTKSVHDPVASKERGKPWHVAKTYVRIQHPGEKDLQDRPVKEDDIAIRTWPKQWEQFQKRQEQVPNGTPVECLFPESPEIAANLHSIAIHTVEQLAGLTAHGMQTVGMGATQWQQKAKQFLDAARGGASVHRMQLTLDKLTNSMEVLSNENAMLKGHLERLLAEREQGVPPGMIPVFRPTPVQAHAAEIPAYQAPPELVDEPLFVEVPDGVEGPAITNYAPEAPRPRGRPPGSKNKV